MAEMSDEEALAHMERERASNDRPKHKFYGSLENSYRALKEKVEREEKERPKVTLFDMANHIQRGFAAESACDVLPCPKCSAAFDTLNRLREEGGQLLRGHRYTDHPAGPGLFHPDRFGFACAALLRSLGVESRV